MERREPTVIDFETKCIESRPNYPPLPVGVAVWEPGQPPYYMGWGHPTKNNYSRERAYVELRRVWKHADTLLFHNGKFDLDVATTHCKLPMPSWEKVHDTLFQAFLYDPNAKTISLKPTAERLLKLKPEEQEDVRRWLIEHKVVREDNKDWGGQISAAPGDLVGKYATGDVVRTKGLFNFFNPEIAGREETKAYDRERQLLPILLENERSGMRVDIDRLEQDVKKYEAAIEKVDKWIRVRLNVLDLNVDSNQQLVGALKSSGVVTKFPRTEKGNDSVAKKSLTPDMFGDPQVASALGYRNRASTCLNMWMRTWLEMATANKGYIYTDWNQVRQSRVVGKNQGARTGRLSCSPPFMNIPRQWEGKNDGYIHPEFISAPRLPLVRAYVLADKNEVIGHRDYNQQELRVLAHFEGGALAERYRREPRTDFHTVMQEIINNTTSLGVSRDVAKIIDLALVYAMGLGKLAASLKTDVATARRMRMAQRQAIPGLALLEHGIKQRAGTGQPVRTWGGRLYYKEEDAIFNGVRKDLGYKLLNTLIQSSSADITKEAIIRYHNHPKRRGRFLLTVHDEINVTVGKKAMKEELKVLKEVMESVELDVPMLTDAKTGPNLGELKAYND